MAGPSGANFPIDRPERAQSRLPYPETLRQGPVSVRKLGSARDFSKLIAGKWFFESRSVPRCDLPREVIAGKTPAVHISIVWILVGDLKTIHAAGTAPRRRERAAKTIGPVADNLIRFGSRLFASPTKDQVGRILILRIANRAANGFEGQHRILHNRVSVDSDRHRFAHHIPTPFPAAAQGKYRTRHGRGTLLSRMCRCRHDQQDTAGRENLCEHRSPIFSNSCLGTRTQ
ncbi:hypothetical protein PMI02_05582 [Novosphingobium sp. AP12]|nr:hypothetical protein PMI02_05582 [Novosphingobium sp. AP12]